MHANPPLLQPQWWSDPSMWCIAVGPRNHHFAERAACGLCIQGSHISRDPLHSDRGRAIGYPFCVWKIWHIHLWQRCVRDETDHKPLEAIMRSIIKGLKAVFAWFGIPDVVVTDNGPQLSSAEFSGFSCIWGFDHVTSSPKYPQSNGKAKNGVKTVKWLFKKCKDSGQSEFFALLDWCNTPTEGIRTSPAQRLLGRQCRTLLPIAESLLKPRYDTGGDTRALALAKHHQQHYCNETTATDGNNGLHKPNCTRRAPAWHKDFAVFRN